MLGNQSKLTSEQNRIFDRFLIDSTEKTIRALENVFGLQIDSSSSSIEISPFLDSEILKRLGGGLLYTVSSSMLGDLQGRTVLLMRADDFESLSEVMRPILTMLFLSHPDTDLSALSNGRPDWMTDDSGKNESDQAFQDQIMDTLAEIGNILIGLYTKAIYRNFDLNSHHSVPKTLRDPQQHTIRQCQTSLETRDDQHLVIENEFVVLGKTIKLWSLISPCRQSFGKILGNIEDRQKSPPGNTAHCPGQALISVSY